MTFNFNNNLCRHFWNISYTLNNVDYVSHFMQNYHLSGFYMNIHTPVSLRELMLDFQPFPTNWVLKDRDYSSCTWRQMLIRPKIPTLHRGVPPPPIKLNRKLAKIQKSTFYIQDNVFLLQLFIALPYTSSIPHFHVNFKPVPTKSCKSWLWILLPASDDKIWILGQMCKLSWARHQTRQPFWSLDIAWLWKIMRIILML